jgi:hypothetical protein
MIFQPSDRGGHREHPKLAKANTADCALAERSHNLDRRPNWSQVAERLAEAHQLVARKKARAKTTARRKRRS